MFYVVVDLPPYVTQWTFPRVLALVGLVAALGAQFLLHGAGWSAPATSVGTGDPGAIAAMTAVGAANPLPTAGAAAGLGYVEFASLLGVGVVALRVLDDWRLDVRHLVAEPRERPLHVSLRRRAPSRQPTPTAGGQRG